MNNGRFKNTLLGQAIALSLNLRMNTGLGNLRVTTSTFTTWASTACVNGNAIAGTNLNFSIPQSVINCLGTTNNKVTDLLTLANKKLGGVNTCSSMSLSDITAALDAVNNGFDKCRIVASGNIRLDSETMKEDGVSGMTVFPNPTSGEATVNFTPSVDGHATMDLFGINGSLAANLFSSDVQADALYNVNFTTYDLPSGVYFIRLTNGDAISISKLVVMKREE